MRAQRILTMLVACAVASPAGAVEQAAFSWTGHDAERCPAWMGAAGRVTAATTGAHPAIVIDGMARPLAPLGSGRYRITTPEDEKPVFAGTATLEPGRMSVEVGAESCSLSGSGPSAPVAEDSEGGRRHLALAAAGDALASGERLAKAGKLADAFAATQSGCVALEAALPAQHPYRAWCEKRLSDREYEGGRFSPALERATSAATLLATAAGERNVSTLAARFARVRALFGLSRAAEALDVARNVAQARTELLGNDHAETLEARNAVALSLQRLGRDAEATGELRALVEAYERVRGPRHAETLRARNNLAVAYLASEEPRLALPLFESVLAERTAALGARHPDTLNTLSNAVQAAYRAGRLDDASRWAEQAYPDFVAVFGEGHVSSLRLRRRLASVYTAVGRNDEAIAVLEAIVPRAQSALGPAHVETLDAATNLARARLIAGDVASALPWLRSAWENYSRTLGPGHPQAVAAEERLGFALLAADQPREALAMFEAERRQPVRLARAAGAAQARFELGERDAAVREITRVLEEKRAFYGPDHPETLDTLVTTAALRARNRDRAGAVALLEQLVELTERDTAMGASLSDARIAALALRVGEDFHQAGYKTLATLLVGSDPKRGLEVAELSKSRSLNDALGVRRRGDALPEDERRELAASTRRLAVVEEAMLRSEPASSSRHEQAAERSRLKEDIARRVGVASARGPALRFDAIPPDAVLIDFLVSRDRVSAFIADSRGNVRAADLGPAGGLASAVEALRRVTASPDAATERLWRLRDGTFRFSLARPEPAAMRVRNPEIPLEHLSQRLLDPLRRAVGDSRRWIISPDGPLAFVPFELLRWQGKRLIDAVSVSYVPSLETLGRLHERRDAYARLPRREFLGVGIALHERLPALPSAQQEVTAIAALYGASATTLLGSAATETAFENAGPANYRRVHLATHALLSGRDARLSAVVMAPAPGTDGQITAVQWTTLALQADIVVLSACDTGLGDAATAIGVVGLPYAMMVSGALSAVLSLWQVGDESARDFMVRFHARLRQGHPAAKALRDTKLELARSKGPWSAPRHWAPYVLYGTN